MRIGIVAENVVKNKNKVYVFAQNVNLLVEIDVASGSIKTLGSIPNESFLTDFLVGGMVYYNNKLFLVPHCASKMWAFDLREKTWDAVTLDSVDSKMDRKFNNAFLLNGRIHMVGYYYPGILVYDLDEKKEYSFPVFDCLEVENKNGEGNVRKDCCIKENTLYVPALFANKVLKFNLDNYDWEWKTIETNQKGFSGIEYSKKRFVLAPKYYTNRVVVWDEIIKSTKEYVVEQDKPVYLGVFVNENNVFIPGKIGTKSIVIKDESIDFIDMSYYMFTADESHLFQQDEKGVFTVTANGTIVFEKELYTDISEETTRYKEEYGQLFYERGFGFNLKTFIDIV